MVDMMDLSFKNRTMLLSNLSFDHPLLSNEINDLINLLSQGVSIGQIYFKDTIDVDSIEKIKLLLEGLPNINDRSIEKYIMKSIDEKEKLKLEQMSFQNIDTWNIAYSIEHNKFSVTTLSKYRLIDKWFNNTIKEMDEDLSVFEKICYLYDKVKLFEFDNSPKFGRLPEIISNETANSYGYNLIFKELLTMCNIPSFIENYELDGEQNYVTIAQVEDDKYEIEGLYLFDPSMDTISKEKYKYGLARRLNYNFFGITLDKFSKLNGQVIPSEMLKCLLVKDDMEYKHYLDRYKRKYGYRRISEIEGKFNSNIDEIYNRLLNSEEISSDIVFDTISDRMEIYTKNSGNQETMKRTLIDNYKDREKDLFIVKSVKKMSKKELIIA